MAEEPRLTAVERRTRAFYEWEIAGRGWQVYEEPVALEPAFRAFRRPSAIDTRGIDDGRRPTWLSSLVEGLRSGTPEAETEALEAPEPRPEPSPEDVEPVEFVLSIPKLTRISSAPLIGWLQALLTARSPLALELLGGRRCVELRLAVDRRDASNVLGQLKAAFPMLSALAPQETLGERWGDLTEHQFSAAEFGLASEFMVPLSAKKVAAEPLLPIIAALAELAEGELGLYQVLFEPARRPWAKSVLRSVVTAKGEPFFADAPEITTFAREKVASPLFAVALRVAGVARAGERAEEIVRNVASSLSYLGSPSTNELIPLIPEDLEGLEEDIVGRTAHRSGMLLSADELVSLIRLPGADVHVPELWRVRHKTKKAPEETSGAGCLLGRNESEGETAEVRLSVGAKTKHVHVVGASGTGKSTLLVKMILEDVAAGHGVGVLDPHGDLVDDVVQRIPEARAADVVMFDPSDTDVVVGWNILGADSETEKDLLTSDLVGVFRRLSTSWGDQMTAVLANAIMVFLESTRGGTLVDLRRFLIEDSFRAEILNTVDNPLVKSFWLTEFPLIAGRKPQAPILTRLDTFLRSRLIRNVVTARERKLVFREVTDSGLIFLGKLSAGAIGEENAALLGSLLVSKLHQVTLARSRQDAEVRRPFFLYIDEFHHVATPSMASLFSGVRKYGLGLTVAHQDLHQLHATAPEVERSLLANAYSRICFRLGEADARQMQNSFSFFDAEDLMSLGLGEAICRVGSRSGDFNLRTEALPGLEAGEAARRTKSIRRRSAARWGVPIEVGKPRVEVAEPRPADSDRDAEPCRGTGPSRRRSEPEQPTQPKPDKVTLDYLESVAAEPFLQVRQRNERVGLSGWKGQQIKATAVESGWVKEVTINPGGRGKQFKLVELTAAGRRLLLDFGVTPKEGLGRGGIAHQWWAETIAGWIEEQGVRARIEDESLGARVDIVALARRKRIAIEIEMGTGHVVENIKKDVDAGFDSVVSLLDDPRSIERVEERLSKELGEPPRSILIMGDIRDFAETLSPLLFPQPPPLAGPNQNQEPRRRRKRPALGPPLQSVLADPGALSTPLAADYVGLSPATLETLRVRGGGPTFVKLGRRVVYRREDLGAWLEDARRVSTSEDGHR